MAAARSSVPASVHPQIRPPDSLPDDRSRIFGATLALLDAVTGHGRSAPEYLATVTDMLHDLDQRDPALSQYLGHVIAIAAQRDRLAAILGAASPDRQPELRAQYDHLGTWLQGQIAEVERRFTRSIR